MNKDIKTFADLIKYKRAEKNLSRSEMARRVGITPQYAMEIERGHMIPTEDKIETIANVLELDEKQAFQLADKIPLRVYEKAKDEYFNKE
jgi:transcriptional regulator with XRE-family HTH domain